MRRRWQGSNGTAVVLTAALVLASRSALATRDVDMVQLPVFLPHECLSCHIDESPDLSGILDLNAFGLDFLDNGRIWDSELAQLDSDGDGCLNGVEVGDSDGDGVPDGNVVEQAGNPGVKDNCQSGSLVDEKTWGALKAMFDRR